MPIKLLKAVHLPALPVIAGLARGQEGYPPNAELAAERAGNAPREQSVLLVQDWPSARVADDIAPGTANIAGTDFWLDTSSRIVMPAASALMVGTEAGSVDRSSTIVP